MRLCAAIRNAAIPLLVCLLLWGCSANPGPASRALVVLPSSVTPGEVVTAYGEFPDRPAVQLNGVPVDAVPAPGGVRFTLPESTLAGLHTLSAAGRGGTLWGSVSVLPRIDAVVPEGNTLRVVGAGWPTDVPGAQVLVDGVEVPVRTNRANLSAVLPRAAAYGPVRVTIVVGSAQSEPYEVLREAAAVQGRVLLPGVEADVPGASSVSVKLDAVSHREGAVLIVLHDADALDGLMLSGLLERDVEPRLGASRLVFSSIEVAGRAAEVLRAHDGVHHVEHEGLTRLLEAPGMRTVSVKEAAAQWHLPLMNLETAWARSTGDGVTVAVVDTGVRTDHPDLHGRLLPGYDFVDGDADANDTYGHGTHVAGLIAAAGRVRGVAPDAQLLPVRVAAGKAGGSTFVVARGILWAAGLLSDPPNPNPAQVINLSLGVEGGGTVIEQAVQLVLNAGVIVVAAAGNSGGYLASPASMPGVISVTAVAGPVALYLAPYANRGPGLQLSAYGGDLSQDQNADGQPDGLLSSDITLEGGAGYRVRAGTSMAAPLVSGLAALALADGVPTAVARDVLNGTATDLGVMGYDTSHGYGLASARAVTRLTPRAYTVAIDAVGQVVNFAPVQADGSFLLANLPPGEPLTLVVASDDDHDLRLAEVGELRGANGAVTGRPGTVLTLDAVQLRISDGSGSFSLTRP